MPNEPRKIDDHDGQDTHELDQSPLPPPVEANTGHEEAPTSKRSSVKPGTLATIGHVAAATALAAAIAASGLDKKYGPKTPRVPPVVSGKGQGGAGESDAGTDADASGAPPGGPGEGGTGGQPFQEDGCDRLSFAQDAKPEEMAKPGESECQFVTDPDGATRIIGHTLIDADGKPRDCFVQPTFSPNAAMKIRGEVHGSPDQQGRIFLDKGKLCVMMLTDPSAAPSKDTEALVIGEASLHIETNQRVIVKILEPEMDPKTNQLKHFALVTAVEGEALINQDGRTQLLSVQKGEPSLKIPLDIEHADNMGCYVATTHHTGDFESQKGPMYMLGAGAIFLVLRRRQRKKHQSEV